MPSPSSLTRRRRALGLACSVLLAGCDPGRAVQGEPAPEVSFEIGGTVLDAVSGAGIDGAFVEFVDVAQGTTAANGTFRFGDSRALARAASAVMRVSASGYAPMSVQLRRDEKRILLPTIQLEPLSAAHSIGPEGGTLRFANGIRLQVPEGAPSSPIALRTAVPATIPMPQQWISDGAPVVYAAIYIGPESVRFDRPVLATIPLSMPGTPGKMLHVYAFEPATAAWVPAGTAVVGPGGGTGDAELFGTGYFIIVAADGTRTVGTIVDTPENEEWGGWSGCIEGELNIDMAAFTYDQQYHEGTFTDPRMNTFKATIQAQYGSPATALAQDDVVKIEVGDEARYRMQATWTRFAETATVEYPDGTVGSYSYDYREFSGWQSELAACEPDPPVDPQGEGG